MQRVALVVFVVVGSACTCGADRIRAVETEDAGTCEVRGDCPCVPSTEVCNGLDDDCNGLIDDGLPPVDCGVGACRRSMPSCVGGVEQTCTPGQPTAEVCNGVDDDCNGAIDENLLPAACGVGECAVVQPSCVAGAPASCQPGAPQAEQCNGKDDNCDGTVDEGLLTNTSGDLRITNDPATSDFVYIGASDSGFGVVWQDKRDGAAQKGEIYFAALDKLGGRQVAQDVRVTTTTGVSTHPAMAWSGQRWGLIYADDTVDNLELYFQALTAQGAKLGQAVRLTNATGSSDWPDVVWTGSNFAVAWEDDRLGANKQDLFFKKLDASGAALGPEVRITNDLARQSDPILKWNGSEFGLAWTDYRVANNREIYFRRLGPDGQLLGSELRVTNDPADSAWPDLAWNSVAHEWAIVWHDTRDGNAEVYFARVSQAGVKVSESRLTNAAGFSGYPSIDWNGFQYGVTWQDDRVGGKTAIYFAAVNTMGVKNGADLRLSSGGGNATYTTALWNGSTYAFCWRDDRDAPAGNTEIYFAYVGCPTH